MRLRDYAIEYLLRIRLIMANAPSVGGTSESSVRRLLLPPRVMHCGLYCAWLKSPHRTNEQRKNLVEVILSVSVEMLVPRAVAGVLT